MSEQKIFLLIGSNSGDSLKYIQRAITMLSQCEGIFSCKTSRLYKTEPWGVKNQNWFLNIAFEAQTMLSEQQLLKKCQSIENILGRNREKETRWGERTMDIDIIFYGKKIIKSETLCIPHIQMHKRAFVLTPLMDLAPEFIHPILHKTIKQIFDELTEKEQVIACDKEIKL